MTEEWIKEQIEKLADIQHEIWSHWMRYMLEKTGARIKSHWTMTNADEQKWRRQMDTPYANLLEKERQSDRNVVAEHGLDSRIRTIAAEARKKGIEEMRDAALFAIDHYDGEPLDEVAERLIDPA